MILLYRSLRFPFVKVVKLLESVQGTPKYDVTLLQVLKGYFKIVLLHSESETITSEERKEWVRAYGDLAYLGVDSKYWLQYKEEFEKLLKVSVKK